MSPLISARQQHRVRVYVDSGRQQGARLVLGGTEMPGGMDRGWYVRPTMFAAADNTMRIARVTPIAARRWKMRVPSAAYFGANRAPAKPRPVSSGFEARGVPWHPLGSDHACLRRTKQAWGSLPGSIVKSTSSRVRPQMVRAYSSGTRASP